MKKDVKQKIRDMSHKEMMAKLNDLNLERMKLETYLRYGGHQNNRASLASVSSSPSNEGRKMPTTLRNVKKMIAFIKQVMHLKYLRKEM